MPKNSKLKPLIYTDISKIIFLKIAFYRTNITYLSNSHFNTNDAVSKNLQGITYSPNIEKKNMPRRIYRNL